MTGLQLTKQLNSPDCDHSKIFNEILRKSLVNKSKVQSPTRYVKRLGYRALSYKGVDITKLLRYGRVSAKVPVGNYICTVEFSGLIDEMKRVLKKQPQPNVTLQTVIQAVSAAYDKNDIYVDCSCPDFIYRYSFWATKYGYKSGKPENRPTKITNPNDKKGSVCKHLLALLSNKRWLVKLSTIINEYIKAFPKDIRKTLDISDDDNVIVNFRGRPKGYMYNNKTSKYINNSNNDVSIADDSNSKQSDNNTGNLEGWVNNNGIPNKE
jgi:hypothetical protein